MFVAVIRILSRLDFETREAGRVALNKRVEAGDEAFRPKIGQRLSHLISGQPATPGELGRRSRLAARHQDIQHRSLVRCENYGGHRIRPSAARVLIADTPGPTGIFSGHDVAPLTSAFPAISQARRGTVAAGAHG